MAKVVIFGTGQTAEIAHYYFTNDSADEIVAFTVDGSFLGEDSFFGLPVVPFENVGDIYPPDEYEMFVAVSYHDLNQLRAHKYLEAKRKQYRLVSYISSKSNAIGKIELGDNCLVLESQVIQPFAKIGNNVAIFGGVLIGHHCEIGDHCWITSEVSIGGNTTIGQRCFLGLNSTIGHMIDIGSDSFIGAGTLVTKSCTEKSVFITRDTDLYRLDSSRFLDIARLR